MREQGRGRGRGEEAASPHQRRAAHAATPHVQIIAVGRKGHRIGEAIELPLQQRSWRGSTEGIQGATRVRHEPRCRTGKLSAGDAAAVASARDGTDERLEGGCLLAVSRVEQHQH